jgi:hypothetical protein
MNVSHGLLRDGDRVIRYRQQYFGFFSLLEHGDEPAAGGQFLLCSAQAKSAGEANGTGGSLCGGDHLLCRNGRQ